MCATVIISAVGGPPHSWGALLRESSLSFNPHLTHWMVCQNCNNQIWVINSNLFVFLILVFPGCPTRAVGGFGGCHMGSSVWVTWSWPTAISRMCGRASVWWRSPLWCIPSMMICVWVSVVRYAPVWTSVIWPGATSLWIALAVTSVPVTVGMWPWPVIPVSVPVVMARCRSSKVSHARIMISVTCRSTWWGYFVWAVCSNMAIFSTIKTFYTGTMACHVPWFLTLETFVIIIWHDIYCGWGQ